MLGRENVFSWGSNSYFEKKSKLEAFQKRGRRIKASIGATILAAGLTGMGAAGWQGLIERPHERGEMTDRLKSTYNQQSEARVISAHDRWLSDNCSGRPCTLEERQADESVIEHDKWAKTQISKAQQEFIRKATAIGFF